MTKKPEKPRAFLLGVVTAELLSDIEAEIHRIEADKSDDRPQTDKIELRRNKEPQRGPMGILFPKK